MSRVHANNFSTTLNGAINNSTTSVVLSSATGFPAVGAGVTCNITVQEGSVVEIMQATAITGSTLTVVRAQEGTSAVSFSDGSTVEIRVTRDSIDTVTPSESSIVFTDVTTNNSSTSKHGYLKKLSNTATEYMNGEGNWTTPAESTITFTDITTNNASTTKHGYLKKLSNSATEYMDGTGNWSTPAGGGGGGGLVLLDVQTASNSSELEFDTGIDSTYTNYLFVLEGLYSGTSSQLLMQISYDVGVTYAADWYMYAGTNIYAGSATVNGLVSTRAGSFPLTGGSNVQNSSAVTTSGQIWMNGPANVSPNFEMQIHASYTGGYSRAVNFVGMHDATANGDTPPVDAVRFYMSSGNITAGTISLYGLQKV
jgi:ethanolamine utilization microcompartment shell protein EutS